MIELGWKRSEWSLSIRKYLMGRAYSSSRAPGKTTWFSRLTLELLRTTPCYQLFQVRSTVLLFFQTYLQHYDTVHLPLSLPCTTGNKRRSSSTRTFIILVLCYLVMVPGTGNINGEERINSVLVLECTGKLWCTTVVLLVQVVGVPVLEWPCVSQTTWVATHFQLTLQLMLPWVGRELWASFHSH